MTIEDPDLDSGRSASRPPSARPQEPPLRSMLEQMLIEAHVALDKLNAPKTQWISNRHGTREEEVTLSVAERIVAAVALREPPPPAHRLSDDVRDTARVIVANLAHRQGFTPRPGR